MSEHRDAAALEAGLGHILASPRQTGVVRLIVRRPAVEAREVLDSARLDPEQGLVGDNWASRPCPRMPDGSPHPDMQLNLMNARAAALVAGSEERVPLAGDQFYLDLDLSDENLPPGTRLQLGSAVVEITDQPHLGCQKFKARFGAHALQFVNSERGKSLNLRGVNAKVVQAGVVRTGDQVQRLAG